MQWRTNLKNEAAKRIRNKWEEEEIFVRGRKFFRKKLFPFLAWLDRKRLWMQTLFGKNVFTITDNWITWIFGPREKKQKKNQYFFLRNVYFRIITFHMETTCFYSCSMCILVTFSSQTNKKRFLVWPCDFLEVWKEEGKRWSWNINGFW